MDFIASSDLGKTLHPGLRTSEGPLWSFSFRTTPPGQGACTAKELRHSKLWFRCPAPCNVPPKWPGAHFPSPECVPGGLLPGSCSRAWTGHLCEHLGPRGSCWQRLWCVCVRPLEGLGGSRGGKSESRPVLPMPAHPGEECGSI